MLRQIDLETLKERMPKTLMAHLDMEVTGLGPDFIEGRMPVDDRTRQIHGVLHGGATAALIESLASVGAALCVDARTHRCVGVELNVNHVRSVPNGYVVGRAAPRHLGRTLQVWQVDVSDASGRLVSTGRLTVAVLANQP